MPYAKPTAQEVLFGEKESWREHWGGMPEYENENLLPMYSVRVNFSSYEDMQAFAQLIENTVTPKTQSVWFPKQDKAELSDKEWVNG